MIPSEFVVTLAPFRVSFAGGGTDLPSYYERGYGTVFSTAINKYVYVIINKHRPILHQGIDDQARHRIRLSYSSTEYVQKPDELNHPIVREALKFLNLDVPMDIATMADVPAGTGLGSSGAFSVALLHALHLVKGEDPDPMQLAEEAAHIEMNLLGRPVGKQDHYAAAFGGLNTFSFYPDQTVKVEPMHSDKLNAQLLFPNLMLMYTGKSRDSGTVLSEQSSNVLSKLRELEDIRDHAIKMNGLFEQGFDIFKFGQIMHNTWLKKRKLASTITSGPIDAWYEKARDAGALGGKICGAGGGGFLLLVVEPQKRQAVRESLVGLDELKFEYESSGSRALVY